MPALRIPSWHQATKSAMVSSSFSAGIDDRQLGLRDVVGRQQELDLRIRAGRQLRREGGGAHIRPARMSGIIASIDWRSASRVLRSQRQPSERIRSVLSRTIGTSPFQPRSPPV